MNRSLVMAGFVHLALCAALGGGLLVASGHWEFEERTLTRLRRAQAQLRTLRGASDEEVAGAQAELRALGAELAELERVLAARRVATRWDERFATPWSEEPDRNDFLVAYQSVLVPQLAERSPLIASTAQLGLGVPTRGEHSLRQHQLGLHLARALLDAAQGAGVLRLEALDFEPEALRLRAVARCGAPRVPGLVGALLAQPCEPRLERLVVEKSELPAELRGESAPTLPQVLVRAGERPLAEPPVRVRMELSLPLELLEVRK